MSDLASFNIESDTTIQLAYRDGSVRQAKIAELDNVLARKDLLRVKRALEIRGEYLKTMPRWLKVMVITVAVGTLTAVGFKAFAPEDHYIRKFLPPIMRPSQTAPASIQTDSAQLKTVMSLPPSTQPLPGQPGEDRLKAAEGQTAKSATSKHPATIAPTANQAAVTLPPVPNHANAKLTAQAGKKNSKDKS